MKTCLTWPAILLILFLPPSASGGTIRTSITTTQTVTDDGAIELDFRIRNNGDVTAHKIAVALMLADIVKRYDRLGDNPAGGEIHLKETLTDPALNPGKYKAVMKVDFEEQTGKSHHAYHFFEIPYRMERMPAPSLAVEMKTTHPCFNRKALWDKDNSIGLSLENSSQAEVCLHARLFLPEGFTSPAPNRAFSLAPGETKIVEIPLRLEPDGKDQSPYHLIVWADHQNVHYSWDLKGTIAAVERPVYFKAYLTLGLIVLAMAFVALLFRKPKPPGTESPLRSDNDLIPRSPIPVTR
ncbi:MAG: hypothetical protein R6X27_12645 [Candidatus Desulfacyla sp.]